MAIEQASYGNRIGRRPARLCLVVPTLGAALVIVGCGGNTVTAGDAGPDTTADGATDTGVAHDRPQPDVADAPALDAPAGDGPALDGPAGDVPNDAAREDLGTPLDGGRCDPEGPADGLVTDPACRAEMATAPTCEGAGPCPITAYATLGCSVSGGYGPWVVPTGAEDGVSVLYSTNAGEFRARVFELGGGRPPRALKMAAATSAPPLMVGDGAGGRVLVVGELPGVATRRETPEGWRQQPVAGGVGSVLLLPTAASFVSPGRGHVAFFDLDLHAPYVASLRDGCWSLQRLAGTAQTDIALDLDAAGRPHTAWWTYRDGSPVLQVATPDGTVQDAATGSAQETLRARELPRLIASLPDTATRGPLVAWQRAGGVYAARRSVGGAWQSWRLVDSPETAPEGDCPPAEPLGPGAACSAERCTQRARGDAGFYGLTATADGTLWAVWGRRDLTERYTLTTRCLPGPMGRCTCARELQSASGTLTLHVARVDPARTTPVAAAMRIALPLDGPAPTTFGLAARGRHLLVVAPAAATAGIALRYLDIDTASLP